MGTPTLSVCEWFLLCDRAAAGVVAHPVLGAVPTCQRCAEWFGLDLEYPGTDATLAGSL